MPDVSIRLAEAKELPDVLPMIHALAAHHHDTSTLTLDALKRDTLGDTPWITLIVAEQSENLLGYAALCPLTQLQFGVRGMDMHHLFVKPSARGQGIGQKLITAAIDHSKRQGCRYMMVGTHPENKAAQAMYLTAGFSEAPAPGPRFRMKFDSTCAGHP